MKRVDPIELKKMISLYESGVTAAQIAKLFNSHCTTVLHRLHKAGVKVRSQKPRLSEDQIKEAIRLYNGGMTLRQIGKIMDRHQDSLHTLLKNQGVKMRPMPQNARVHPWNRGGSISEGSYGYKVQKAIKDGIIKKLTACEVCGQEKRYKNGKAGVHAHHDDYNFPLKVRWLCRKCHHEWHMVNEAIPLRNQSGSPQKDET